ncbi:MAG: hypothetical protein U0T83_08600 [Bacteriovoracaceae bacterium]
MNIKLIIMLLLVSILSVKCASRGPLMSEVIDESDAPIDDLIDGWRELITFVENNGPSSITLKQEEFILKVKLSGNWNLEILPKDAFSISKIKEQEFSVYISNPRKLFDESSGLLKMVYIQAKLSKVGGNKGTVSLSSDLKCMYPIKFYQPSGIPVDFGKINKGYSYDFIISDTNEVNFIGVNKEDAIFSRRLGSYEEANVKIRLQDRKTGDEYIGKEVKIPACTANEKSAVDEVLMYRTPGQCARHLKTKGTNFEMSKASKFKASEVFTNNCETAVKCVIKSRYGYVKKGKILDVKEVVKSVTLNPYEVTIVDTSYDFDESLKFDSKIYFSSLYSKDILPKNYDLPSNQPLMECVWLPK